MPSSSVLLVEGVDDEHVIKNLLGRHAIAEGLIQVKNKQGIFRLLEELPVELRSPELLRLGIVADADTDLRARWDEIRDRLLRFGYAQEIVPRLPTPEGTVIQQEDLPDIGIWLMPDNRLPGMLEHFVELLVPPGDMLWARAGACIADIPLADRRFPPADLMKAQVHTWLAWQAEPGKPLGLAIKQRYLDANAALAQQFIGWVRRLFVVP